MNDFAQRVKALKLEVEALKAARRRNSTTLRTITKTATCTAQLYKTSHNVVLCRKAGLIEINQIGSDNEFVFGFSQPSFSNRGHRYIILCGWAKDDGTPGVLCVPRGSGVDNDMAQGAYKNVTISVTITATSDFTLTSSQILNDDRV